PRGGGAPPPCSRGRGGWRCGRSPRRSVPWPAAAGPPAPARTAAAPSSGRCPPGSAARCASACRWEDRHPGYEAWLTSLPFSALTLLVPRVAANDKQFTVPADQLAVLADPLHTRSDLHR